MEDKLFTSVINNDKHVLSHILPDPNECWTVGEVSSYHPNIHTYNLRPRRHELTLAMLETSLKEFFKHIH